MASRRGRKKNDKSLNHVMKFSFCALDLCPHSGLSAPDDNKTEMRNARINLQTSLCLSHHKLGYCLRLSVPFL